MLLRLTPQTPTTQTPTTPTQQPTTTTTKLSPLAGYDLDAVTVEFDGAGDLVDVRFELGRGFDICWAVPVAPQGRLRLLHVDSAVYHVDEPTLELDPCALDIDALEWRDAGPAGLGVVGGGRIVESVMVRASSTPSQYWCEAVVRDPDGRLAVFTLRYAG